jgi:hypothetical protein
MEEDEKILRSIIKSAQRDGMPSTFRLCRDDRKYGDVLFASVDNLKSMVRAGMGEVAIMTRKDLTTISNWIDFCQSVSNGFSYCYAVDPKGDMPLEVKTLYDFPPQCEKIGFDVVGLMPAKETLGVIFSFTSIRQEQGVPDITCGDQIVFISSYDDDYVLSLYVDFIVKSSCERSVVKAVSVMNATANISEVRQYEGKSDDDLRQLAIELVTKVGISGLSISTLSIMTTGSENWSFLMKNYEIEF